MSYKTEKHCENCKNHDDINRKCKIHDALTSDTDDGPKFDCIGTEYERWEPR